MPKRNNPFGDFSSLQLKTHVRTKEVDQGVCQQVRMQSVYERTHNLLFSGMRQSKREERPHDDHYVPSLFATASFNSDSKASQPLKQMHLGKNCELLSVKDSHMEMESDCGAHVLDTDAGSKFHNTHRQIDCNKFLSPRKKCALQHPQADLAPPASLHESIAPLAPQNVFQQMILAQAKNSTATSNKTSSIKFFTGACHSCRQSVSSRDVMKCQFCENYVCGQCTHQCRGCHMHFCQLCSLINYDQVKERAFCLSCSKLQI